MSRFDWREFGMTASFAHAPNRESVKAIRDLHRRVSALEDTHRPAVCTCDTLPHDPECQMAKAGTWNGLPSPGIPLKGDEKIEPVVLVDRSKWPYIIMVGDGRYELAPEGFQIQVDEFVEWVKRSTRFDVADVLDRLRELGLVEK